MAMALVSLHNTPTPLPPPSSSFSSPKPKPSSSFIISFSPLPRFPRHVVRMAPEEKKVTRRSPLDFPIGIKALFPSDSNLFYAGFGKCSPTNSSEQEDFNSWNFWRLPPPAIDI